VRRGPRRTGIVEVLNTAIELEARAMRLYVEIANRFKRRPQVREFWLKMARYEAGHCGALMLIQTVIESRPRPAASQRIVWFDGQTVVRLRSLLAAYLREVRRGISLERACEMAVDVEGSELEDLVTDLLGVVKEKAWHDRAVEMLSHDMDGLRDLVWATCSDDGLKQRARDLSRRRRVKRRKSPARVGSKRIRATF